MLLVMGNSPTARDEGQNTSDEGDRKGSNHMVTAPKSNEYSVFFGKGPGALRRKTDKH